MITLRELFKVNGTITRVEIQVRNDRGLLLHEFYLGEKCDPEELPPRPWRAWEQGKLTASGRPINSHGKPTRYGPEQGWGLEEGAIPKELLDAEVCYLHMRSPDMIRYHVTVQVYMQELTLEMVKAQFSDREAEP